MLDEKNIVNDSSSLFNGNHFPSLAGKEAPSSVLINYLWRYNYSEYGTGPSIPWTTTFQISRYSFSGRTTVKSFSISKCTKMKL